MGLPDECHRDAVKSAELTPDSKAILTTSWDGTARLWPTDPLLLARARQPRELTAEEKEPYGIRAENR
jgi:hypothetical protein